MEIKTLAKNLWLGMSYWVGFGSVAKKMNHIMQSYVIVYGFSLSYSVTQVTFCRQIPFFVRLMSIDVVRNRCIHLVNPAYNN